MVVDSTDSKHDAFQCVGCKEIIDRERFVVVGLVLCFFQASSGGRTEEGGDRGKWRHKGGSEGGGERGRAEREGERTKGREE